MTAQALPAMVDTETAVAVSLSDPSSMSPRHANPKLNCINWANLVAYVFNSVITYTSLTGVYGATNTELSAKYQTLVTPAGWAFSIWGPIFLWEGVFVVAQMLPKFRRSEVTLAVCPWWCSACLCQIGWTFAFAQEIIPLSLVLMICILISLAGATRACIGAAVTWTEWTLLRAPFSLHLGWIICASVVNTNVQIVAQTSSQRSLLTASILSFCFVGGVSTAASIGGVTGRFEPILCLVAAWACAAIASELRDPDAIAARQWSNNELASLADVAVGVCVASILLAFCAVARGFWIARQESMKNVQGQP